MDCVTVEKTPSLLDVYQDWLEDQKLDPKEYPPSKFLMNKEGANLVTKHFNNKVLAIFLRNGIFPDIDVCYNAMASGHCDIIPLMYLYNIGEINRLTREETRKLCLNAIEQTKTLMFNQNKNLKITKIVALNRFMKDWGIY